MLFFALVVKPHEVVRASDTDKWEWTRFQTQDLFSLHKHPHQQNTGNTPSLVTTCNAYKAGTHYDLFSGAWNTQQLRTKSKTMSA